MPEIDKVIEYIFKKATELGLDLESMGISDAEDLQVYALKFLANHLEDFDVQEDLEIDLDDELEEEF